MAALAGDAQNRLVYIRGVVALCGEAVDASARSGLDAIPADWRQRRVDRDGEGGFHATFLTKGDLQTLGRRLAEGEDALRALIVGSQAPVEATDLGSIADAVVKWVARGPGPFEWVDAGEGRAVDGDSTAAFRVLLWPAGARARKLLGLPPHDFHISLGFSRHDVHGKSKGLPSLTGGGPPAAALPPLLGAAKRLLAAVGAERDEALAEGIEEMASVALQAAEWHQDGTQQVASLELLCQLCGRMQRPRQMLQRAERLLMIRGNNAVGLRSQAIALMALKRHAEALPAMLQLQVVLAEGGGTGESAAVERWLQGAITKCREILGVPDRLYPGAEDFADEAGDQMFEAAFHSAPSKLKFPSTAHFKNMGAATRDDKVCSDERRRLFCGGKSVVAVEEKVDGANLGISLDSVYRWRMQGRSKMVNWETDNQFAGLEQWLNENSSTLCEILERNNDILFGEWCAFLHTVKYNRLPGYFLAFDIYDKRKGRFLSRESFHTRLQRATGSKIPAVPMVCPPRVFASEAEVEALLDTQSQFGVGTLEGVYLRVDEAAPAPGERESYLVDRCKLVRSDFQQAIEDEGSWRGRGKNDLDMDMVATYTETCYPCAKTGA